MKIRVAIIFVRSIVFGLILVCATASWAQSPPIGIVVQGSHYDATKAVVTFDLLNVSHKDITAFQLLVRVTHPDGTMAVWGYGGDYLPYMLDVIELGHPALPDGNGALAPGAMQGIDVPLGPEQQFQSASATVDLVVYADGTADVIKKGAFEDLQSIRKGRALGLQKANELLQAALADTSDPHPSVTVVAQLKALIKQTHDIGVGTGLQSAVTNISNAPKSPTGRSEKEDDYLRATLLRQQNRVPRELAHARLTN